ncbi:hypothetical protein BH11PLA2_BH11PLA2_27500 [soil metagenome]
MPDPDDTTLDETFTKLFSTLGHDVPPPDPAMLDALRESSLEAFRTAPPTTPRKPAMIRSSFRWLAAVAAVAAVLVVGIVLAQWIPRTNLPAPPQPEVQFAFSESLIDDGRIGKVTDAQGMVSVKPVLHKRWSPVQPQLVLKPGDWLRTDSRGANAVAVKLLKSVSAIVGPHSTVELVKPNEINLLAGEIEITASADTPVELHGPDKATLKLDSKQHYRIEKDKLVRVEKEPLWLQGFKGTTTNESIGSLIATIDGRNVPLTVGFHHVTVEIRDQIARTTIEESFVNRSDTILEGVFHFPLPADASISGFGMWIGNNLVEADVVEKQRAREIYETILREKRDPGLLEWAGGNIFKARVYPIPAHAEKRIRISYTQVLPRTGNRYRYSYALQSDLLIQHPLRDLSIDLTVNSAVPLKNVTSPTHTARIAKTDHSGHVEFTAQEYTPTRDFEAVIEVGQAAENVVVIPHRRGDDGYFMVQFTPPGSGGDWERPLIPNGDPMHLLILADTSASMDTSSRIKQNAVLAALLGSLTAKDTVNVAACDVNCSWIFDKPTAATAANIATIETTLAKRSSLGWTDLDKAFASAMTLSNASTHVIYIGDGIITTGDADIAAFAKRMHQLNQGVSGTFHAITVGSSYEATALKAIASLGGGSVRHVTGERVPSTVALELLSEIATPSLKDLKVSFAGLRTARVYPEELPNIPAGTQQILLGRFLPEGVDQNGEIVITGRLGDKDVRYTSKVSLKDAEQGNSFIPRLWARMHLDKLLEQGTNETVKQDIIALSEEFNIITPYTSLLVLETDADRERFAVKTRFRMRDGERFFAAGQDNALIELKQKQMQLAGSYRTTLRRQVMDQLLNLGRDFERFQELQQKSTRDILSVSDLSGSFGGGLGGEREYHFAMGNATKMLTLETDGLNDWSPAQFGDQKPADGAKRQDNAFEPFGDHEFNSWQLGFRLDMPEKSKLRGERSLGLQLYDRRNLLSDSDDDGPAAFAAYNLQSMASFDDLGFNNEGWKGAKFSNDESFRRYSRGNYRQRPQLLWLNTLYPPLASPSTPPKESKISWPAESIALSKSLLRSQQLAQQQGGLVLARQSDSFDPRRGELSARSRRLELVSPTAWLGRTMADGGPVIMAWCNDKEYAAASMAMLLGRTRTSTKLDLATPPLELSDHSLTPLHEHYVEYLPAIETINPERALLILKYKSSPEYEQRFLIDTKRHVMLNSEHRDHGKVLGSTKFDNFVEMAGSWWAKQFETFDREGRRTLLVTQTITEVPADEFTKRMTAELAGREKVLFLKQPLPSVAAAKASVIAGKATFEDRTVLTVYFAASQQWARAAEHLAACERLAGDKRGLRHLVTAYLLASRRNEDVRLRLLDDANALSAAKDDTTWANDHALAEHLFQQAQGILQANEQLMLLDKLKPIAERQPRQLQAYIIWRQRQVALLFQAGQPDMGLAASKSLAADYPLDSGLQYQHAQRLAQFGDHPAAYAWIDKALKSEKWHASEEESLRGLYVQLLQNQGRYHETAAFLASWMERKPTSEQPYAQYLMALVRSNQANTAEEAAAKWLSNAQVPRDLTLAASMRFNTAVNFALGQGFNHSSNRIEQRWHKPLAEVVLFFARREPASNTVSNILNNWRFSNTDDATEVRKKLAGILVSEFDTLTIGQIANLIAWAGNVSAIDETAWRAMAAKLSARWTVEPKPAIRHQIGQVLLGLIHRFSSKDALDFQRQHVKSGPVEYRVTYVNDLFNTVLSQSWTAGFENEAFALLDQLAEAKEPAAGLATRVSAQHRLTDAMLEARYQSLMKKLDHPKKLTRAELQMKQDEARKQAREGFANRLKTESAKQKPPFANWLLAERLWIEIHLDRDLPAVANDCWLFLDSLPAKVNPDDETSVAENTFDELLRERFLVMVQNITTRKGAAAALAERLLKYIDAKLSAKPGDAHWRSEKYRLLIALDRPKDLEADLRRWTSGDGENRVVDNRWRIALSYLLAEQGQVAEAIKLFEAVEAADELPPKEYRTLAMWYLVENRREQHQKATTAIYKTTEEYELSSRIGGYLQPWQNAGHLPTKLDTEVLLVFKVLFEKSASPQNYLYQLQSFYQASHDFRFLAMLADGIIGQTEEKVYPFLGGMNGVLSEVRDEATADELLARLVEVRKQAKTIVDHRALDLLELLVERRATELQNQPAPHAAKALAALTRAFDRKWSAGEPRLMADFLAGLGRITQKSLATEQLRQLAALHRDAPVGTIDRLQIAQRYSERLHGYTRTPEAIDRLEAALKEFEDANNGVLPISANSALDRIIGFTEDARHYGHGERLLFAQLQHPIHHEQRNWLTLRLNTLYIAALANNGDVSLGKDATLYKAIEKKLIAELAPAEPNHRNALIGQVNSLYRKARDRKLKSVTADVKSFAFKTLPPYLKDLSDHYEQTVQSFAVLVHDLVSPRDAIAFLLDCIESEPDWQRYNNRNAWTQQSHHLAEWRLEAKDLGELEPRLLKYILGELRRDLRGRENNYRTFYSRRHNYHWPEKDADFYKAAMEIYEERKASAASVEYIAEYLFWGLPREKSAIEILIDAHQRKILSKSGQWQLVDYLHRQSRYAESIPLLLPLVETRPENLDYRTKLMHAYYRTNKSNELLALLKATDTYFHADNRWNEGVLAGLAYSCLDNHLYTQSVAYYGELIPLHQRTQPRRGVGNGTLSNYYSQAAQAYAGHGKTKEAVDMASGAVVSWGPREAQRGDALKALLNVLVAAPDLAAYVAELDKEKLQSAIVRKAIGQAYLQKNDPAMALRQLQVAAELQPNDREIHAALVECFDKVNDKEGAINQLLQSAELSRRDIALFEQLGNRYAAANQPVEAERAYTSIVEMLARESESHTKLAEIREKQNRWPDAILHWERVVAIRSLEPTGLLSLAKAQIHEKDWMRATETLQKLKRQTWPERFRDVPGQIRELEKSFPDKSKE